MQSAILHMTDQHKTSEVPVSCPEDVVHALRYDTIVEFKVDSKAEYSALSSTRSQNKKPSCR